MKDKMIKEEEGNLEYIILQGLNTILEMWEDHWKPPHIPEIPQSHIEKLKLIKEKQERRKEETK